MKIAENNLTLIILQKVIDKNKRMLDIQMKPYLVFSFYQ